MMCLTSCTVSKSVVSSSTQTSLLDSFEIITDLDLKITETSGLEFYNNNLITHNDSDTGSVIYFLDTLGTIQSQTEFKNIKNVDWEDIARSKEHFFIADIGNNYGNRKDLAIYKIPLKDLDNPMIVPKLLELEYNTQTDFEIRNQYHSYDGEAIVYVNDQLFLFSKDWTSFNTNVYALKQKPGKQKLVSTQNIPINGLVTGATTNGKNRVVLCGYNSGLDPFAVILKIKNDGSFELVERVILPLKNGAQIEAITFYKTKNNQEIYYLTSEAVNISLGDNEATTNGQLYKMTLKIE